jgi:hypothetical protein
MTPGDRAMTRPKPKPPTFDWVVAAIAMTSSLPDLRAIRETSCTYFMGTQREHLESAVDERERELSGGKES